VRLLAERSGEATKLLEGFGMVFHRDEKGRLAPALAELHQRRAPASG
jgi:succinate dehydrogenase/fumarate reductase flavoprotein subunit